MLYNSRFQPRNLFALIVAGGCRGSVVMWYERLTTETESLGFNCCGSWCIWAYQRVKGTADEVGLDVWWFQASVEGWQHSYSLFSSWKSFWLRFLICLLTKITVLWFWETSILIPLGSSQIKFHIPSILHMASISSHTDDLPCAAHVKSTPTRYPLALVVDKLRSSWLKTGPLTSMSDALSLLFSASGRLAKTCAPRIIPWCTRSRYAT